MGRVSAETRAAANAAIVEGRDAGSIADEFDVSLPTVNKWIAELHGDPGGLPPPIVSGTGGGDAPKTRRRRAGGTKAAPITEKTAGMLLSGMFAIAAMVDRDSVWLLTDGERTVLSGPFADSLLAMPQPVADGINTYAAPMIFATSLATVVIGKTQQKARRKMAAQAAAPRANGQPTQPMPPPPQHQTVPPRPAQTFATEMPPGLADILAKPTESLREEMTGEERAFS